MIKANRQQRLVKFSLTKYCIVFFLPVIFLLRGVEALMPLFAGYLTEQSRQEMEANSEAKNSGGKVGEKLEKEFLSHFFDNYAAKIKFTLVSNYIPVRSSGFERKIFLPVFTPPPEF